MIIGLAQMDVIWEEKESNKIRCEQYIADAARQHVDLLVFPEMTLTGFSNNINSVGETQEDSNTILFFKKMSRKYNMALAFGYVERGIGKAKNKLAIVVGGRVILDYTKIHPFSLEQEDKYFKRGDDLASVSLDGVNIGAFICYDLRFPEVFHASAKHNQLILVIANWPKSRVEQWRTLLKARAIENQCYIAGVNRVGEGNGLIYEGSSALIDPMGNMVTTELGREGLIVGEVDPYLVEEYREEFPVRVDRRDDLYRSLY